MRILTALGIVTVLLLAGLYFWQASPPEPEAGTPPWPTSLFDAAEAFEDPPRHWEYRFPSDHGSHPDQFGEYWWVAGQLHDEAGRTHGFQLAIYRLALSPERPATESRWGTRDLYRGQLVLEPAPSGRFQAEERFGRDAIDLSGSDESGAWLEDWSMAHDGDCGCFRVQASTADSRLDLNLHPPGAMPVPIRGIPGLDSLEPGSHGYWWPGMRVTGVLEYQGRPTSVTGDAVLEHVWGRRLPVAQGQLTMNRMWLSLDDGSSLRCLQLRRRTTGGVPLGDCLMLAANADPVRVASPALTPVAPGDGTYPLRWRLDSAEHRLTLDIVAPRQRAAPDFLLPLWSGLVQSDGTRDGQPIQGWGWLELSGY